MNEWSMRGKKHTDDDDDDDDERHAHSAHIKCSRLHSPFSFDLFRSCTRLHFLIAHFSYNRENIYKIANWFIHQHMRIYSLNETECSLAHNRGCCCRCRCRLAATKHFVSYSLDVHSLLFVSFV